MDASLTATLADADVTELFCHIFTRQSVVVVGACARNIQVHVGVIDDYQGVAFFYRLIFVETDFLYVALDATDDRHYLSPDLGVVSEFDVSEMDETASDPNGGADDYSDCYYVGDYLFCSLFHIFPVVNRSL